MQVLFSCGIRRGKTQILLRPVSFSHGDSKTSFCFVALIYPLCYNISIKDLGKFMAKLSVAHKVIIGFTVLLWAIWTIYAIVKTDVITANDKVQSFFGILASLMIVINLGFGAVIVYPDISYTSRKINDNNRDKIYYYRRITYCLFQLIYTFFLGGMSISAYYSNWRIGFSVVVPIFLIAFFVVLILYGLRLVECFKIAAPADAEGGSEK